MWPTEKERRDVERAITQAASDEVAHGDGEALLLCIGIFCAICAIAALYLELSQ